MEVQRVKGETFIQTVRSVERGNLGGEDSRQGSDWRMKAGEVAAGRPGEALAGPTFACG